jgi:hypothetical protein
MTEVILANSSWAHLSPPKEYQLCTKSPAHEVLVLIKSFGKDLANFIAVA